MSKNAKLTAPGFKKKFIGKLNIKGGLTHPNRTQKVMIEFYYATRSECSKVVLTVGIAESDSGRYLEKPKSLRFNSYGDMYALINFMLIGRVMLGRDQKYIFPENIGFHIDKEHKAIRKAYRGDEKEYTIL